MPRTTLPIVPVTHPEPTDATVKQLYANALRCAEPSCGEPLYRLDTTGTARTLNSRVAHICARREGGPRWNAGMSAEDNRSAGNLVLLCTKHASEIDEVALVNQYPVPLLLEWKQAQIVEYDRAVEAAESDTVGYRLTDAEAREVIDASEHNTHISLQAHTIQIGGSGGSFGGGGGGGGVVGTGAMIGGRGGGGGETPRIVLDGQPGKYPGAGGGGGGVLTHGTVEPPPRIGTEGLGYVAGIDGSPGGDTTVEFDGKDGEKLVLTAAGGKAGLAGSGIRLTSDRLAVSTLLVASYNRIQPSGLATLVDAGWQYLPVLNLPADIVLPVFTLFEAGGVEVGEYTVTYEVFSPDGEARTAVSMAVGVLRPGDLVRIPFTIALTPTIDAFGIWRIGVRSELASLATFDVMIRRVGEAGPSA